MPNEVLIVADDLSGAADCAIPCAVRGLPTEVVLSASGQPIDADVLAIDANTRQLTPAAAAAETARLVAAYGRAPWCFKKIDSTLRGNVGPEIAAALGARRAIDHRSVVIVAPAFPAMGRTTVGGYQHVHGVPLERTEFWLRERIADDASVTRMLDAAGLATSLIPLADVRAGIACLSDRMQEGAAMADAVVCDAETEHDLAAIAKGAMLLGHVALWAGTAGLSRYLPDAVGITPSARPVAAPAVRGPILFVSGSPSSVSREQADVLAAEPGVVSVDASDVAGAAAAFEQGRDVIVRPERTTVAAALAPLAARASALVLTGGETARALLTAMGIGRLRLVDEVERGVPRSIAVGAPPMPIVTKAGAFGDTQTFVRCRRALRNSQG